MKLSKRRSIRLQEYDYSQMGYYFVTICTKSRKHYFCEYPKLSRIVKNQWFDLSNRFIDIRLDEFIIMPNHIHGIIGIVGAGFTPAHDNKRATARVAPTLGDIIGAYKSLCIHEWLKYIRLNELNCAGKFWQRNYYERVIRNDWELHQIREYIRHNPETWDQDENNIRENTLKSS